MELDGGICLGGSCFRACDWRSRILRRRVVESVFMGECQKAIHIFLECLMLSFV